MRRIHTNIRLALAALLLVSAIAGAAPAVAEEAAAKTTIVHLSHFTDDLHATTMAVKLAGLMQTHGTSVVLFLDLEGVRAADDRQPQEVAWGHGTKISDLYATFVKAGGKVVVCPHCAQAVGLDSAALRDGARIVTPEELAVVLNGADRILDY